MLKIYNTLTRQKEVFKPIYKDQVGVYTCGPTVYDFPHIGNLRSYIFSDLVNRALGANGFNVKLVMNITDVDDKTIKRAQEERKSLKEVTQQYTEIFLNDLKLANIVQPSLLPKATEEISGMVELIKILLNKGIAYKTSSNDIYFNIAKFAEYGKIAQVDLKQLKENAEGRMNKADEYGKENVRDFALWKAYDDSDGDVYWETELGKGRPGWHIECSVMSSKYLGQPFDIHMGGIDLVFPHHTNEIAQSEAAYGKPLANYWLHAEHLLVDNTKMSKSKNNFYTTKDIIDKNISLLAFKYLTLTAHYRSKLNFTWESLSAAQNALYNLYEELSAYSKPGNVLKSYHDGFMTAVNDDFDTPKAIAVIWDMLRSDNAGEDKLATAFEMDKVLGLSLEETWLKSKDMPAEIASMINERENARKAKDFAKSDELRKAIEAKGYLLEDTIDGAVVKKKF